jgi:hypothetical protein
VSKRVNSSKADADDATLVEKIELARRIVPTASLVQRTAATPKEIPKKASLGCHSNAPSIVPLRDGTFSE